MLQPALRRTKAGLQASVTRSIPAPVGGWNARDPLSAMPQTDAVTLENWFPRANSVDLRPGAAHHVTGFSNNEPKTLLPWNGEASQRLFAATNTGIYEVTTAGTVGSSVQARTNGYCTYTNFTVAGGTYLFVANGVDSLVSYNGTTWAVPAITGVTLTSVKNVAVIKRRLWLVANNSATAYYLPVGTVAGAVATLALGQVFSRGGYLVAIGSWTIDGGDGQDDYSVFVSSEGELAVYKGSDPSTATDWALVGVYYVGEPLGVKCLQKFGGDLLYLSQNGLFPLSKTLLSATISYRPALTSKIDTAFTEAVAQYGALADRWSVCVYPRGSVLLVNIPVTSTYSKQYAMNTITGAWTVFSGWSSACFEVFQEELYFTTTGSVAKGWTGESDFGANITGTALQAYSPLGAAGLNKHVELLRPIIDCSQATQIRYSLNADYVLTSQYSVTQLNSADQSLWGTATWGNSLWGGGGRSRIVRDWITVFAREGFVFSLGMQVRTSRSQIRWISTDFLYRKGGVL